MEGYIFNAHNVLVHALDPSTRSVPADLVNNCKGVVIITMVEVGAIVSLKYGTGVIMKKEENGSWSPPSSVSIGGTSFGAVVGGKRDDILIFIMDDENMTDFEERPQSRICLDAAFAAGPKGAGLNIGKEAAKKGTISITFSKGAYAGVGIEMFTLGPAAKQNELFYGKPIKAKNILGKEGSVEVPPDTQVTDLYAKLELLSKGETWTPGKDDIRRSLHFASMAKQKSELLLK
jgi:lipid-binding SYLF domain-containing protein